MAAIEEVSILFQSRWAEADLSELMPIQIMSTVKLENKDVVDLRFRPHSAIKTEKKEEK